MCSLKCEFFYLVSVVYCLCKNCNPLKNLPLKIEALSRLPFLKIWQGVQPLSCSSQADRERVHTMQLAHPPGSPSYEVSPGLFVVLLEILSMHSQSKTNLFF